MSMGPQTRGQAAMEQIGQLWPGLPEEVRAALTAGVAADPAGVLGALTGGEVTELPEGQDLDAFLTAAAPTYASIDLSKRNPTVTDTWAEPPRPGADTEFQVGVKVQAPGDGPYRVSYAIYDDGQRMLHAGEVDAEGEEVRFSVPGLASGQYTIYGYANSEGVDAGQEAGDAGYRSQWYLGVLVGELGEGVWGAGVDLSQAISNAIGTLSAARTVEDVVNELDALVNDLVMVQVVGEGFQAFYGAVERLKRRDMQRHDLPSDHHRAIELLQTVSTEIARGEEFNESRALDAALRDLADLYNGIGG